jgi:hypothetical protein
MIGGVSAAQAVCLRPGRRTQRSPANPPGGQPGSSVVLVVVAGTVVVELVAGPVLVVVV